MSAPRDFHLGHRLLGSQIFSQEIGSLNLDAWFGFDIPNVLAQIMFIKKILYRLFLLIADVRTASADQARSWIVKYLTNTPSSSELFVLSGVFIEGIEGLKIGNGVSINQDCFISAYGGITIGNKVSIGHRTSILTSEHQYSDKNTPIREQPVMNNSVNIGNDVWIGANVTILSGVKIPDGSIIGAGSVVTKSFTEENAVYCGNPARFLKGR